MSGSAFFREAVAMDPMVRKPAQAVTLKPPSNAQAAKPPANIVKNATAKAPAGPVDNAG